MANAGPVTCVKAVRRADVYAVVYKLRANGYEVRSFFIMSQTDKRKADLVVQGSDREGVAQVVSMFDTGGVSVNPSWKESKRAAKKAVKKVQNHPQAIHIQLAFEGDGAAAGLSDEDCVTLQQCLYSHRVPVPAGVVVSDKKSKEGLIDVYQDVGCHKEATRVANHSNPTFYGQSIVLCDGRRATMHCYQTTVKGRVYTTQRVQWYRHDPYSDDPRVPVYPPHSARTRRHHHRCATVKAAKP